MRKPVTSNVKRAAKRRVLATYLIEAVTRMQPKELAPSNHKKERLNRIKAERQGMFRLVGDSHG